MTPKEICHICNNQAFLRLTKEKTRYFQCENCQTLFSGPLENDNMIGGGNEVARNEQQNHERISRAGALLGGYKQVARILDYGCGHGMLVADLRKEGFNADGYDLYNPEFDKRPERGVYNLITAIEVIEHLSHPYLEVNVMHRSLAPGGMVMIETSFVDVAKDEGIELEDFFYISPAVGHATIFSHHGLDVLMTRKGFEPDQHINRHVRMYRKKN